MISTSQWIVLLAACFSVACSRASRASEEVRWRQPASERAPQGFEVCDGLPTIDGWAARVRDPRTEVVFRFCPRGEFTMGSPPGTHPEHGYTPPHTVRIERAFYLAETETTRLQWAHYENLASSQGVRIVSKSSTSHAKPDVGTQPIVDVSWDEVTDCCAQFGYRLPSEAEWEYAARAGTTTEFEWGNDRNAGKGHANLPDREIDKVAPGWERFDFSDGYATLAPVASFKPNGWGFYDMTGNVWEWCQDAKDYGEGSMTQDAMDVENPDARVVRGGGFQALPSMCRLAYRAGQGATEHTTYVGFRAAIDAK